MQICTNYAQISPFLSKKNPAGDHLFGLRESDSLLKFSACRKMVSVLGFLPSCASGAAPVSNSPKRGFDLAAKSKTPVGSFILWGGCLEGCIWGGGTSPPSNRALSGSGEGIPFTICRRTHSRRFSRPRHHCAEEAYVSWMSASRRGGTGFAAVSVVEMARN